MSQLAPGLWMWSFGAAAHDSAGSGATPKYAIWGAGALAAVIALILGVPADAAPALGTDPRLTVGNTVPGMGAEPAAADAGARLDGGRRDHRRHHRGAR